MIHIRFKVSPHPASNRDFLLPTLGLRLVNIGPGTSRTVELNADTPGSYPFFCDLPGHAQRGQLGTLVIGGKQ